MRLIDADLLIVAMLDHGVDHVQADDLEEINQIINDAPTVDAEPVVQCEKCKYNRCCLTQEFVRDEGTNIPFDEKTFFCADGKRKEDEP